PPPARRLAAGGPRRACPLCPLCGERTSQRGARGRRAFHPLELLPRHRAPAGLSAFHADRPSLHRLAFRLRRVPRTPGERAVRRFDLRRSLALCPRAGCRALAGVPGRAWPRPFPGLLVAGHHRRGLHAQHLLLRLASVHGAAGLPAWSARRCERWPQPPAALDGAGLRPELEQSLSADAARRTRVRHPALAAAPRAAPALRPALLARHSWARALCVDGAPL